MTTDSGREKQRAESKKFGVDAVFLMQKSDLNLHEKLTTVTSMLCTIANMGKIPPDEFDGLLEVIRKIYREKATSGNDE